jgi:hypothetical protein
LRAASSPIAGDGGMRELDASWSARLDVLVVEAGRARYLLPGLIALAFALCVAVAAHVAPPLVPPGPLANVVVRLADIGVDIDRGSVFDSHPYDVLGQAEANQIVISADAPENWDGIITSTAYDKFPPIRVRRKPKSLVRKQYARLAAAYLSPFPAEISRASYMDMLDIAVNTTESACSGCFLIQVVDGKVYAHDPLEVRTSIAPFREMRMREALHWTTKAVQTGALRGNTEFVVATQDGVVSTSRPHSYRMSDPDPVPRPIFTVSRCNCSDNIPFPMHFMDILRRVFPETFWTRRNNTLDEWDDIATDIIGSQDHETHVWGRKKSQAVFRGSIRVPSIFHDKDEYEKNCDSAGRTALLAQANAHAIDVEQGNADWDRKYWLWLKLGQQAVAIRNLLGALWAGNDAAAAQAAAHAKNRARLGGFEADTLLDVQINGKCGGREYTSDKLDMGNQTSFKYSIHAEGNGMWADRLAIQLFGSSAIIKQSTACGMWFEPLLESYRHYIPVDQHFSDIVRQVRWAKANDEDAQQIVRNAREFAGDYLSVSGVETFAEELLVQYSARLAHNAAIVVHPRAMQIWPAVELLPETSNSTNSTT